MRHLFSHTVYSDTALFGDDVHRFLGGIGADGIELLTSYERPDGFYRGIVESVHLPYATDWMSAWNGRPYDLDPESARYYMFGYDRDEIVSNIRDAVGFASDLSPSYGVFHAANGSLKDLYRRRCDLTDESVLKAFCEMMNRVVSDFPGGEPPFRILFENLWWPGLRLVDDSDFRIMQDRLEFDNWGICLDTGHLMNCLPDIRSEQDGINALESIFSSYCSELVDRIDALHFHWSASWDYRSSFTERELSEPLGDFISSVYPHITRIDQHMPFSDPSCRRLVEILDPTYLTHELPGSKAGIVEDFVQQRNLFQ